MTRLGPIHLSATAYRSAGLFVFLEVPDPQDILIPIVPSCFSSARRQPHTVPPPKSLNELEKISKRARSSIKPSSELPHSLSYDRPLSKTNSKLEWESAVSNKGSGQAPTTSGLCSPVHRKNEPVSSRTARHWWGNPTQAVCARIAVRPCSNF